MPRPIDPTILPTAKNVAAFWANVRKGDGCWEWQGARTSRGYGEYTIVRGSDSRGTARRRRWVASRFAWETAVGPIPHDLMVLHRCDNRVCVRPHHLFLGTNDENMADMVSKGRQFRGEAKSRQQLTRYAAGQWTFPVQKLTAEQAAEIIQLYRQGGISQKRLGERYGVTQSIVSRILSGHIWKRARRVA